MYCWSPRHIFIRWQKLAPALDKPNGIWVNLYRPDEPAWKAVFTISISSIASWRYHWARSKDVNHTTALTACSASSILGNGNESWTVIAFKALKSIHNLLTDYDYLWGIQTMWWVNDTLKLNQNRMMGQVNWFIHGSWNFVFEVVTKT